MAISLLAGCGGGGGTNLSASQMLLNLMASQYANMTVKMDQNLEAKLRQAVSEGATEEEVRDTLEQLLGVGISFDELSTGQQGDSSWNLMFYPGSDSDAAARAAYTEWDKVFRSLPVNGRYGTSLAIVETDDGYYILVESTVTQAGTEELPLPASLQGIKVAKDPQLIYWEGEAFNPAGMVLTATYSDGTTKTIENITAGNSQGVTWKPETIEAGTKQVTISYGGQSATVDVTSQPSTVKSIVVTAKPQTSYIVGEAFNPTGMELLVTYLNGTYDTIENITPTNSQGVTWTPETIEADTKQVTISYGGQSTTLDVSAQPLEVTSISVSPVKLTRQVKSTIFLRKAIKVTARYSNGTSVELKPGACTYVMVGPDGQQHPIGGNGTLGFPFDKVGEYTLKVSYKELEDTVTIKVIPASVTGISAALKDDDTTYHAGDKFSLADIVVTATYSNNTIGTLYEGYTITGTDPDGNPINATSEYTFQEKGDYIFTVHYNDYDAEVKVSVGEARLDRIEASLKNPNKIYYGGGTFTTDDLIVTAYDTLGHRTEVTSGYTVSLGNNNTFPFDTMKREYLITVTYEGMQTQVLVTVHPPIADFIEVTIRKLSDPSSPVYYVGDIIDAYVQAHYSTDDTIPLHSSQYKLTVNNSDANFPYTFPEAGDYTFVIKYQECVKTVTITVSDRTAGYYKDDSGTYIITNSNGLKNLYNADSSEFASANIRLESDNVTIPSELIDAQLDFAGKLDGQDHTITLPWSGKALFKTIATGAVVENVTINITGGSSPVSSSIGTVAIQNHGTIENCQVTGSITITTSSGDIGGIVAQNFDTIKGSSSNINVQGSSSIGGIAGSNQGSGEITACCFTGRVSKSLNGGIIGGNIGGIAGENSGTITACYAAGDINGMAMNAIGGVVGYNSGTVSACYWKHISLTSNGIGQDGEGDVTEITSETAGTAWRELLAAMAAEHYYLGGTWERPTLTKATT